MIVKNDRARTQDEVVYAIPPIETLPALEESVQAIFDLRGHSSTRTLQRVKQNKESTA